MLPVYNPTTSHSSASSSLSFSASSPMLIKSEDDDLGTETRILTASLLEDDRKTEGRPILSRTSSYTNAAADSDSYQQRPRRVASDASLFTLSAGGRRSSSQDAGRAASDTYVTSRLCFNLWRYLGVGYGWIIRILALGCYSFLIFPGFIQVAFHYFHSSRIRRGILYGDQSRNRLDIYLPKNSDGPKPVVAFVSGGAWIVGYKAWGSLLGIQLSERDVILACIDYRNFPQGTISDMVNDASQGISFVFNNIAEYGGDPNRIYLMGQSAGAHIAACALLEQGIREAGGRKTSWSVSQIKSYFGLSGGYNFLSLADYFHTRGLYRSIFLSIMEGEESLRRYSPEVMVQDSTFRDAVSLLPPIHLFHGTADYSIPSDASKSFAETLQSLGVQAQCILYEGKTHTDLFVQDPMRGGRDDVLEDLVAIIHSGDIEAQARDATAPPRKRLVPECMLNLAGRISPL